MLHVHEMRCMDIRMTRSSPRSVVLKKHHGHLLATNVKQKLHIQMISGLW